MGGAATAGSDAISATARKYVSEGPGRALGAARSRGELLAERHVVGPAVGADGHVVRAVVRRVGVIRGAGAVVRRSVAPAVLEAGEAEAAVGVDLDVDVDPAAEEGDCDDQHAMPRRVVEDPRDRLVVLAERRVARILKFVPR